MTQFTWAQCTLGRPVSAHVLIGHFFLKKASIMSHHPALQFHSNSQSGHVHCVLKSFLTSFNGTSAQNYLREKNKRIIKLSPIARLTLRGWPNPSTSHRCYTSVKNNEKQCTTFILVWIAWDQQAVRVEGASCGSMGVGVGVGGSGGLHGVRCLFSRRAGSN